MRTKLNIAYYYLVVYDFNIFISSIIRGLFKRYADCLNCAARVGFRIIEVLQRQLTTHTLTKSTP